MNYLIIGTGGVGGCIAGFLALAGKDVTCIARGKHLEAIRRQGLHLKSDLKGEHFLRVKACTAEEYQGKAEVIKYDDFIRYGSEAAVREAGKLNVEGKEYVVEDGDIMHFRFNV